MIVFLGNDTFPSKPSQTLFTTMILLLGIGVFATIIGSASTLLSSLDASAEQKKNQVPIPRFVFASVSNFPVSLPLLAD